MLKLEKTVCFESADWNSNIWVHRPFFCQLKNFPVIDYVRTVKNPARCFSARSKSTPSKPINRQGIEIKFPSRKQHRETKNFQNDARQETFKILKSLKMNWCIFEYSNFPQDHDLAESFRDWDSTLWTVPEDIPQCKSTEPPGSAPYDFF